MSNSIYYKLLRHRAPLQIDPNTHSFRTSKHHSKMFYAGMLVIMTVIFAISYVMLDFNVLGSIKKPPYMLIMNLLGLIIALYNLSSIVPALLNSEEWWVQYINNIVSLERKLLKPWDYTTCEKVSQAGFLKLLTTGKFLKVQPEEATKY